MKRPSPPPRSRHAAVELALQGGGSHGAFTWGVLDRLLEEPQIEFAGLSGASAGAMNAVVLASGLLDGGREGARDALRAFWTRVGDAAALNPLRINPFAAFFGDMMSRVMSPYQFNPLNLNPLKAILAASVDFKRLRGTDTPRVFVSATAVATGSLRVFRRDELDADRRRSVAVLAPIASLVAVVALGTLLGSF